MFIKKDFNKDRKKEGGGFGSGRGGSKFGSKFSGKMDKRKEKKDDVLSGRLKKKTCRLCEEKVVSLDYKDVKRLERLIGERGKILSRRVTGTCAKHQRKIEEAVKKARFLALLPFLKK